MENDNIKLQNAIDKVSEQIESLETKHIGGGIYEFRSGDFVVQGE